MQPYLKFLAFFSALAVSAVPARAAVDLTGYDGRPYGSPYNQYYFDLQQTAAKWGENIGVRLAVTNIGSTASTTCKVRLYLSKNTTIGDADDRVFGLPVSIPSIPGGGYIAGYNYYENFLLPTTNPYGDSSTVFYIGMVVDADGEVAESNETNNRNQGTGIDKDMTPITITAPAPAIQLSANGTSLPPASSLSVAFGNVAADGSGGAALTQTVSLANTGDLSLSVTGISVSGTGFSLKNITSNIQSLTQPVTFPRAVASQGQEAWSIEVDFDPATATAHSGSLVVTSNDTTRPSVTISLSGTGTPVPQLSVNYGAPAGTDPRTIDFGAVINDGAGGANAERTVTLTNPGTGPLTVSQNGLSLINGTGWQIVSITSNTQGVINLASAAKTIAAAGAETWSVLLRFDPASVASFSGGFQILSNDPNEPTYALALNGSGVVPMTLEVRDSIGTDSDRAMDFGRVHADGAGLQKKSGTVTLKNTGGAPLTISQNGIALGSSTNFQIVSIVSSTQGAINLAGGTGTIASGGTETWTVNLVFDPTTSGALATQLQILSDDPSQGTVPVALSGTGLNQPGIDATDSAGAPDDHAMDFGPTLNDGAGGRTRTHTISVKNIGIQPLVVAQNGISVVNGPKFSVQSIVSSTNGTITISSGTAADRTIAPLGAETWTVTTAFDPDANSSFSGTVRISSNDPDYPTVDFSLSGSGVQPTITLNPTTSGNTLFIPASQVYPITWTANYSPGSASISLYRDTDTNPANGNTLIVENLAQSAGSSYEWRPDTAFAGQEFYLYATIEDGTIKNGSFTGRKFHVDPVGAFQLRSAIESASVDYAYEYEYLGSIYTGTASLQPGQNTITVETPLGGGTATHQFTVTKVDSLLHSEAFTYDEMHRVKTFTNGNGIVTTYTFDLGGRLTRTEATNGSVVTFTYDELSRRTSMTDNTGTTFFEYDDL
ncbi:MAG: choice-of-anchor D domain-containing protein, partial [Terrimicrobiaceae bacterium]